MELTSACYYLLPWCRGRLVTHKPLRFGCAFAKRLRLWWTFLKMGHSLRQGTKHLAAMFDQKRTIEISRTLFRRRLKLFFVAVLMAFWYVLTNLDMDCTLHNAQPMAVCQLRSPSSEAHTFGRIFRLLCKIADRCGPKALLSPMVARRLESHLLEGAPSFLCFE